MSARLGDLLVKESIITQEKLTRALEEQKKTKARLGSCKLGFVSDEDITTFLSRQYGVPSINLTYFEVDPSVIKLVPEETARRYEVLPLSRVASSLTIAMVDPTNVFAMDDIKFMTGFNIEPVVASETAIQEALKKFYGSADDQLTATPLEMEAEEEQISMEQLEKSADEAPVVKLVNVTDRSGDAPHGMRRNDTTCRSPPLKLRDAITSRIKIMSKLDISEKRLPQDGRIMMRMSFDGRKKQLDYRVSVLPTLFGEKVVMRLLDKENLRLDMTKLGFEQESLDKFERAILKPYGMVLVTGPTGSGKTNTLYSSVARLNQPDTNIVTAEDPVEFQLPGINQVQMKEQIGLNFAAALRSFLRQDPNIILVGEIRDFETAEIAIKAALTGHMVLSTLHTNDAPSTISRLMNMGIEPFLVATSVLLICAQRLIRRLCNGCKVLEELPAQAMLDFGFTPEETKTVKVYNKGPGCEQCNGRGMKGRVGLYEVLEITDELRELVLVGASALELKRKAIEQGMISLRRSGLRKVMDGVTTIEEVVKETVL